MDDITFQTDAGKLIGSLCEPPGCESVPGAVVLHEALGQNGHIRTHCQRFADEGYLASAPNLYSRGAKWRCLVETFRTLSRRAALLDSRRAPANDGW